jgi:multiple sugar transport system substrate-binding protein
LVALDEHRPLAGFAGQTVGNSHESYFDAGHQWALAIDGAAQVSARRAGALDHWPTSWDQALHLARDGRVICPLAPVHALMSLFTLRANLGVGDEIAFERLCELAGLLPDFCFELNPIDVFEKMAADERYIYSPLIYGYVSYARDGFRQTRIDFSDIPGIRGSVLGGTGIAVSASSRHRNVAVDIAFDLASAATQHGLYASAGGQPAHRAAWLDDAVNADTHNFYRNTLATLDASQIRPRTPEYIRSQKRAGEELVNRLKAKRHT